MSQLFWELFVNTQKSYCTWIVFKVSNLCRCILSICILTFRNNVMILQHIDRYHLINESLYTWLNSINWSGSSKQFAKSCSIWGECNRVITEWFINRVKLGKEQNYCSFKPNSTSLNKPPSHIQNRDLKNDVIKARRW